MTIDDKWLLERARKKKEEDALATRESATTLRAGRVRAAFAAEADELWGSLQAETRRQGGVYNDAVGDPDALVVKTEGDLIDVRATDGRQLTIRLDRDRQSLSETFRNSAGAVRMGRPRIAFAVSSTGRLGFNFGVIQSAAGSILRRVLD